jgi:hypothetical protein
MRLCHSVPPRVILSIVLLAGLVIYWGVNASHNIVYAANNTYYVAKNGSDNNPGTLTQPWLTIQKAARTMVAGDTVNIQAGTYNEKVSPANSGNAASPITYQSYGSGTVILDGTGKSAGSAGLFDVENKSYITLKGIQIQNSDYAGAFVYGSSDHITLQNLTIHNTAISGICAVSSGWSAPCTLTNLTIDGCTIYATNSTANQEMISLTAVNGFEIKNCIVHEPKTDRVGIDIKVGCQNGSVHNCEVYNTGAGSNNIYVDAAGKDTSNISIYNNKVHSGSGAGIVVNDERGTATLTNINIYNNLVWGNRRGFVVNSTGGNASYNFTFINNTLYNNNSMTEIWINTSKISNSAVRNNLVYNTLGAALLSGVPSGIQDHNLTTNPQFNNAAGNDFHLQSTSPAIDAGSSTGAKATDFDGNTRPQGAGYDIGAYEGFSAQKAALDHITVSPSSASVKIGGKQTYIAQGYDSNNNPISGLTYTWSVSNPAAGSISSSGVFTAGSTIGSYANLIRAVSGGKTGTASVSVTAGAVAVAVLNHITLNPSNPSVTIGGSVSYTAQGYDSSNNPISGLTYTWSVNNPAAGSISPSGVFTAGTEAESYPNVIQVTSGNKTAIGSVVVSSASTGSVQSSAEPLIIIKVTPVFSNLSAPVITYEAVKIELGGTIKAGDLLPSGEVSITLNGVTQNAAIDGSGNFSANFNTGSLSVAGSPYTISYIYNGDNNIIDLCDNTKTLTVNPAAWDVNIDGRVVISSSAKTMLGVEGSSLVKNDTGKPSRESPNPSIISQSLDPLLPNDPAISPDQSMSLIAEPVTSTPSIDTPDSLSIESQDTDQSVDTLSSLTDDPVASSNETPIRNPGAINFKLFLFVELFVGTLLISGITSGLMLLRLRRQQRKTS